MTWKGKDAANDSWMLSKEFIACFPSFELEGQLGFDERGIDKYQKTYFRKKKAIGGNRVMLTWKETLEMGFK